MDSAKTILELKRLLSKKSSEKDVQRLEYSLAESIEEISTNADFFDLPTKNVLNIIKLSESSDISLLSTLAKSMNAYKGEDAVLLLNVIDSDEGSLNDYVEILSNLENCPICKRISDMKKRNSRIPTINYPRKIKALKEKICDLESKLPPKQEILDPNIKRALLKGYNSQVKRLIESDDVNIEAKDVDGKTMLHLASYNGNLEVVKYLIDKGANIESKDKYEKTPLHWASYNDNLEVVKYLIDKGANIESKDKYEKTPLHWASYNDNLKVVGYLIDKGANIEAKSNDRKTPLHLASYNGNLEVVGYLIDKGAKFNETSNCHFNRKTPLYYASRCGHAEVVKYLIEHCHADFSDDDISRLSKEEKDSLCLLHKSCEKGDLPTIQKIISEDNFKINQKYNGYTPLHYASSNGHIEVVKYLIEHCHADIETKNINNSLNNASRNGHIEVVKYLIEHCYADFSDDDIRGLIKEEKDSLCLLHKSCEKGDLPTIQKIISEDNFNINQKYNGETPLHYASSNGRIEVVKYLIEHCHADFDDDDIRGLIKEEKDSLCLLHKSCEKGDLPTIQKITSENNFNINQKYNGRTPLNIALFNVHVEVVKYLIEHCHADVETKNINNSLHYASCNGHIELVKYLIKHCHADVETKDINNLLISASRNGHIEVVKYLVEHCHADVETKHSGGRTPLNFALINGNTELVKYLVEHGAKVTEEKY